MSRKSRALRKQRKQQERKALTLVTNDIIFNDDDIIQVVVYGSTEAEDTYVDCVTVKEANDILTKLRENKHNAYVVVNGDILTDDEIKNAIGEEVKPLEQKTKTVYKYSYKKQCHKATEIVPGVIVSDRHALRDILALKPDILVPLATMSASCWSLGFRGIIYGLPIDDFSVLPKEVINKAVKDLAIQIKNGRKVAIFCEGGHGRTGYVASILIGILHKEIENPIQYLRDGYCQHVVETQEQINSIANALNKPELKSMTVAEKYAYTFGKGGGYSCYGDYDYGYSGKYSTTTNNNTWYYKHCGDCDWFSNNHSECRYDMTEKKTGSFACRYFIDKGNNKGTLEQEHCDSCEHFLPNSNIKGTNIITGVCGESNMYASSSYPICKKFKPIFARSLNLSEKPSQDEIVCKDCRWFEYAEDGCIHGTDKQGLCTLDHKTKFEQDKGCEAFFKRINELTVLSDEDVEREIASLQNKPKEQINGGEEKKDRCKDCKFKIAYVTYDKTINDSIHVIKCTRWNSVIYNENATCLKFELKEGNV